MSGEREDAATSRTDSSDDEEGERNSAEGVLVAKKNQKKVRVPPGTWGLGQEVAVEDFIKEKLYKFAPILDTESFEADDALFNMFAVELRMNGREFTREQKKSIIAMTKYRLDQTRSRDRKIAFKNAIEQNQLDNIKKEDLLGLWKGKTPDRNDRTRILFLINGMLAPINTNSYIKNSPRYRATRPLHEVVTPQAVALCYLWIVLWVPFHREKVAELAEESGEGTPDEETAVSSLTEEVVGKDKKKKRGRVKGNPSYLTDISKKMYTSVLEEVSKNMEDEDQLRKWDEWWRKYMAKVVNDSEKEKNENGKKRKRNTEVTGPLLPTGAALSALMKKPMVAV